MHSRIVKSLLLALAIILAATLAQSALAAEQVDLGIITVKDKALAEQLRKKIAAGESFEKLAREHSVGLTASRGGRLGLVPLDRLRLEYRQAVRGLPAGQPSRVIPTEEGYSVLMRFKPPSLELAKPAAGGRGAPSSDHHLQARQAVMGGVEAMVAGNLSKAEAQLSAALGLNPQESSAAFMLEMVRRAMAGKGNKRAVADFGSGFTAMLEGKVQKAADLFHRAAQADHGLWQARLFQGNMLAAMGKLKQAGPIFEQLAKEKPNSALVYVSLGNWNRDMGQPDKAKAAFKKALAISPENPQAHYELGSLLFSEHKIDQAADHLRKSVAADPYSAEARNDLGLVLMYQNKANESEKQFKKAQELNPAYPQAHVNLGNLYARTKRLDQAIDEFNKALAMVPNLAQAHANLAVCYTLKRMWPEAIEHADLAAKLGRPVPPPIAELIEPHRKKPLILPKSGK